MGTLWWPHTVGRVSGTQGRMVGLGTQRMGEATQRGRTVWARGAGAGGKMRLGCGWGLSRAQEAWMSGRRGPINLDELVAKVLARSGKTQLDSAVLLDVAEALLAVSREDLAAEWAGKAYRRALSDQDAPAAARAVELLVARAGREGRRALRAL